MSVTESELESLYSNLTIPNNVLLKESSVCGSKFEGISLSSLGQSSTAKNKNPFYKLRDIAIDKSKEPEVRMQSVRYMVKIPHIHMLEESTKAAISIINDDNIPINERYFFFSNTEKYIKLDGHLVQNCHLYFFKTFRLRTEYPLIYTILSAQVVYCTFLHTHEDWECSRQFMIQCAKDKSASVYTRSEAADVLLRRIVIDDYVIGKEVIAELGELYFTNKKQTIYTDAQNAHNETINESVMNIIRALAIEKKRIDLKNKLEDKDVSSFTSSAEGIKGEITTESIFHKIKKTIGEYPEEKRNKITDAFHHIIIYPSKYEGLNMSDIMVLIWSKIQSQTPDIQVELEKRMLEELEESSQTCGSGYVGRLVNVLSGFVQEESLQIRMSFKDQLRCNIFARIQGDLKNMGQTDQDIILEEISDDTSDKETVKTFIEMIDIRSDLVDEFVKSGHMKEDEFNLVYDKSIADFIGK